MTDLLRAGAATILGWLSIILASAFVDECEAGPSVIRKARLAALAKRGLQITKIKGDGE